MDQLPIAKILAAFVVAVIIALSRSKNPDISDIGSKLGLGLLGIGFIVFIFMKVSGSI